MSELIRRAGALRASDVDLQRRLAQAGDEWGRRSRENIAEFIRMLSAKPEPTVQVYAETWRKGDPRKGDKPSPVRLGNHYPDVQTGYMRAGEGWVVQEYNHNGGDIEEGVLIFTDGQYTKELSKIEHKPAASLANVPHELPFYVTGPRVFEGGQLALYQTAEFADDTKADMLARALMRYGVA